MMLRRLTSGGVAASRTSMMCYVVEPSDLP
jgi:hypothetical protein